MEPSLASLTWGGGVQGGQKPPGEVPPGCFAPYAYVTRPSLGACQSLTCPLPSMGTGPTGPFSRPLLECFLSFGAHDFSNHLGSLRNPASSSSQPQASDHPCRVSPQSPGWPTVHPALDPHALCLNTRRCKNELRREQLLILNVSSRTMPQAPLFTFYLTNVMTLLQDLGGNAPVLMTYVSSPPILQGLSYL